MLFPYNTDAPIYHWPFATVGLIVANVVCFFVTDGGSVEYVSWVLTYGEGMNPLQWISSLFLHLGPMHLIGNMLFLWAFGLVVEGKIGWKNFLLVYFGLGVFQNVLEQGVMEIVTIDAGGSAGASGVLFGLMAMSMVWAPKNDIHCYFFAVFRLFQFEISILSMCGLYVLLQVVMAVVQQFAFGAEVLHLVGASLGFFLGVVMVQRNWVDCEDWDLFSVWRGKNKATDLLKESSHVEPSVAARRLSESGSFNFSTGAKKQSGKVDELIAAKKFGSALRELQRLQHLVPDYELQESQLGDLIRGLYRQKQWGDVTALISEFIQRFPQHASGMRLRLSAVLLEVERRPRAALRAVEEIDESRLKPRQAKELAKIRRAAQKLIDSGHMEVNRGR